ncbi:MAG: alpha/beta hydrolase [Oleiphilaceae bacterium]|nr:alpha/beta hydrolase [Oleiphilaceae bacterium]
MDCLLLRGLGRESEHWGGFPQRMAAVLAPGAVHTLDLPGMGANHRETSPLSVAAIRARLQARAAKCQEPLLLVGLSMGGMVALDWARQAPGQIAGVVTINTSSGLNPPWQRLHWQQWSTVLELMGRGPSLQREAGILALTSNRPAPAGLLDDWRRFQQQRPVTRRNVLRQLLAASRYRPAATPPAAPVLLLSSRGDRLVSSQCSRTLSRRWDCPLREHGTAGHDLPLDDPEWVLHEIRQWLTGHHLTRHGTDA